MNNTMQNSKKLPPYGQLLYCYQKYGIVVEVPIYIFCGRDCFNQAKNNLAHGTLATCLTPDMQILDYLWPVKGTTVVIYADDMFDQLILDKFCLHLLNEGAATVFIESEKTPNNIQIYQ